MAAYENDAIASPPMPLSRILLGVLGSAAFGLLVGGLLAALVALQLFGYRVLTVESGSMEPTLQRGDLIVTQPVDINKIQVGQVILFETGRDTPILVAHRVVALVNLVTNFHNSATGQETTEKSRVLQTKGDANATADSEFVDVTHLRGALLLAIPGAGLLFHAVPIQVVLLCVAALSTVGWIIYETWERRARRGAGRRDMNRRIDQ